MLRELKIKSILKFMKDNKYGEVVSINYKPNINDAKVTQIYSAEPYSIEVRFKSSNGNVIGIVFSKHGVANLFDGKRYTYPIDSEERFSKENPEFHPLTLAWTKMTASQTDSTSEIENELDYRRKLYKKLDKTRSEVGALKSYYKNQYANLEDNSQANSRLGIQTKKLLDDYVTIAENLSACKALNGKCVKALEVRLEEVREQE